MGIESFTFARKDGSFIENEYRINNSRYLGVVFSGLRYTYRNPLLHYSRNILFDNDIDYLGINYGYYKNESILKKSKDKLNEYFEEDARIIIDKIMELIGSYDKIFLIGKSIGIKSIRQCLKNETLKNKSVIILLTPAVEWEEFINDLDNTKNEILVIGSFGDKNYNVKNLSGIYGKKNIKAYELKEGDHSLETNDTIRDIETLKAIMTEINSFIKDQIFNP
jgi:phosphoglycolate phosphatase